ncbi:MAG: hypothetical protein ACXVB9_15600 [Bdellovibrionota bacterium]
MFPKLLYFLVPAALLLASALSIVLWERLSKPAAKAAVGDGDSEGAFRSFYHALWVLMLWSGLCLSLPLWVSYKEQIGRAAMGERGGLMLRVLALPAVLLLLLWYGGRQGYLKWIDGLSWPDSESNNKDQG